MTIESESGLPRRDQPAKCGNPFCAVKVPVPGDFCGKCRSEQALERTRQQQRRGLERAS